MEAKLSGCGSGELGRAQRSGSFESSLPSQAQRVEQGSRQADLAKEYQLAAANERSAVEHTSRPLQDDFFLPERVMLGWRESTILPICHGFPPRVQAHDC